MKKVTNKQSLPILKGTQSTNVVKAAAKSRIHIFEDHV